MPGTTPLISNPVQLDDNLVNGQTYSFQFHNDNFLFTSGISTLLNDLDVNAPNFLTSVQITNGQGLTTSYLNVLFTYEGDGSDVVSDVASSMIAAFQVGSGDAFDFVAGYSGNNAPQVPASQVVPTPAGAVGMVASSAISTATDAAKQLATGAGGVTNTVTNAAFTAILPWLIGAVLILVILVPVLAKGSKTSGLKLGLV